jgi:hypothetical protein
LALNRIDAHFKVSELAENIVGGWRGANVLGTVGNGYELGLED